MKFSLLEILTKITEYTEAQITAGSAHTLILEAKDPLY